MARNGRTLLLVDADPSLRTIARLHLVPAGWNVLEAPDPHAALAVLRRRPVDVAVCAVDHATLDAAACLRGLRGLRGEADPAVRAVPVLLLSQAPGAVAVPDELRPAAVLAAPPTGPRLSEAIDRLLEG